MSWFFIICTVTKLYYVGFIKHNYNSYDFFNELIQLKDTYIPRSNIDYIKLNIPYDEYVTKCQRLGIDNQEDYKTSMLEYKRCISNTKINKETNS